MYRILLVCAGNICRSPTAEAVLRKKLEEAGLSDIVELDSAGTHGFHAGDPPDRRAQTAAHLKGYDLSTLRARKVNFSDFEVFDLILAMDNENMSHLLSVADNDSKEKIRLFLSFSETFKNKEVPDPYYGGVDGFEQVLLMIEDGAIGIIKHVANLSLNKNV